MTENIQNLLNISKIELAFFNRILPGNFYNCFNEGRGVCGLVIALSGESEYKFKNGTVQKISAGQAALFSDNAAYIAANKSRLPFEHYVINFSLSAGSSFDSDVLIKPVNFKDFFKKAEKFFNLLHSGAPMSNLRCIAVLYDLIADMLENDLINNVGANAYHTVLPAIHYIDSNFSSEITVSSLAKMCVMSNTNFRRVFTAVCGISPIQYLINVRISRAQEYLTRHDQNVFEIAQLCGFKDVEHFCRTFKKRTGLTPLEFSRQT